MFQVVEGGEKYAEQDLMVCGEIFFTLSSKSDFRFLQYLSLVKTHESTIYW